MKPVVCVTWLDASRVEGAVPVGEQVGVVRESVGWLLRDDDTGVLIAMSHDEGAYERGFGIPRAYIQSVEKLGRKKGEKE